MQQEAGRKLYLHVGRQGCREEVGLELEKLSDSGFLNQKNEGHYSVKTGGAKFQSLAHLQRDF